MSDRLDIKLRDGTPILARPLVPADREALAEAYRRLSPEARYNRFWTHTGEVVGDKMLDRILGGNPDDHMTWAVLDLSREFPPLGGASWWKNPEDPTEAEISMVVLDEDQGRGVGTLLLAVVWLSAFRAGVTRMVGYTHIENRRAAKWMRDCGADATWDGYKLIFRWRLDDLDGLPETLAAADLADWLANLAPEMLG